MFFYINNNQSRWINKIPITLKLGLERTRHTPTRTFRPALISMQQDSPTESFIIDIMTNPQIGQALPISIITILHQKVKTNQFS